MSTALVQGETWLAARLKVHGFDSVLDEPLSADQRRERLRKLIVENSLEQVLCGRGPDRKPNTYAQVFARLYGCTL
jgi:hypothetical protein